MFWESVWFLGGMNLGDKLEEDLLLQNEETMQIRGKKLSQKRDLLRLPAICEVERERQAWQAQPRQVSQPPGLPGESRKAALHWWIS